MSNVVPASLFSLTRPYFVWLERSENANILLNSKLSFLRLQKSYSNMCVSIVASGTMAKAAVNKFNYSFEHERRV